MFCCCHGNHYSYHAACSYEQVPQHRSSSKCSPVVDPALQEKDSSDNATLVCTPPPRTCTFTHTCTHAHLYTCTLSTHAHLQVYTAHTRTPTHAHLPHGHHLPHMHTLTSDLREDSDDSRGGQHCQERVRRYSRRKRAELCLLKETLNKVAAAQKSVPLFTNTHRLSTPEQRTNLCQILTAMLMQLASTKPALPMTRVSRRAETRKRAEKARSFWLYLQWRRRRTDWTGCQHLTRPAHTDRSISDWLMRAKKKHSVIPFSPRRGMYAQKKRISMGPEQRRGKERGGEGRGGGTML